MTTIADRLPRPQLPQRALKKSLNGQAIFKSGPGRYTCPLLTPAFDGLPFSMALDLFQRTSAPSSHIEAKAEEDVFSLQYILDGTGQLVQKDNQREAVLPGDSILAPHGHTFLQPVPCSHDQPAKEERIWDMASLSIMLPKDLAAPTEASAVLRASGEWNDLAVDGRLTEEDAQQIIAGAKSIAQQKTSKEDLSAVSLLPRLQHTGATETSSESLQKQDTGSVSESPSLSTARHSERQDESGNHASDVDGEGGVNSVSAKSAPAEILKHTVPRAITLDSAISAAVSRLGGLGQLFQQMQRWRHGGPVSGQVFKKNLGELSSYRLPHQTNRLALVFDPLGDSVNFTFGVEIFEPGHRTTPHVHQQAHELFFILAGEGEGFCDEERFTVAAGDIVVFPPGSKHGIDVGDSSKMYCLEVMQPNDMFAELVRAGMPAGGLQDDDLCILIAAGCA